MDGRIFPLINELNENLDRQWTVAEMALVTQLSAAHFQKLFKAETGSSPKNFLKNLRLEKACEFITAGFLQIKQIRLRVGFTDDSHFTRDFKNRYGLSPTEYRKKCWNLQQRDFLKDKKQSLLNTIDGFRQEMIVDLSPGEV